MARILLINPNSSAAVTRSMDSCLDIARRGMPHALDCITIEQAPPAIESENDIRTVIPLVVDSIASNQAAAYVIACFSDPGLAEARNRTDRPVIGIGEAGYLAALGLGARFGVVSILEASIARHASHVARLGLFPRLAGDRAIGFGVAALSGAEALDAIVSVGRRLRDEDGAEVLVLGCAGMGQHRASTEEALGIPVVDPVQAAALLAGSIVTLDYRRRAA